MTPTNCVALPTQDIIMGSGPRGVCLSTATLANVTEDYTEKKEVAEEEAGHNRAAWEADNAKITKRGGPEYIRNQTSPTVLHIKAPRTLEHTISYNHAAPSSLLGSASQGKDAVFVRDFVESALCPSALDEPLQVDGTTYSTHAIREILNEANEGKTIASEFGLVVIRSAMRYLVDQLGVSRDTARCIDGLIANQRYVVVSVNAPVLEFEIMHTHPVPSDLVLFCPTHVKSFLAARAQGSPDFLPVTQVLMLDLAGHNSNQPLMWSLTEITEGTVTAQYHWWTNLGVDLAARIDSGGVTYVRKDHFYKKVIITYGGLDAVLLNEIDLLKDAYRVRIENLVGVSAIVLITLAKTCQTGLSRSGGHFSSKEISDFNRNVYHIEDPASNSLSQSTVLSPHFFEKFRLLLHTACAPGSYLRVACNRCVNSTFADRVPTDALAAFMLSPCEVCTHVYSEKGFA